MTSYVQAHPSCGHFQRFEVSDEMWEHYTRPVEMWPRSSPPKFHTPFKRIGRRNRVVYVYPDRFMLCKDCVVRRLM